MIKRIFTVAVISVIISSCGNTGKKEVAAKMTIGEESL